MTATLRTRIIAAGLTALLAGLLALTIAAGPAADASVARKHCSHAKASLQTAKKRQVRDGLECLIAKARKKAGRHSLSEHHSVRKVSQRHARTMVKGNCFRHVCDGEGSIQTRLKQAGYLKRAKAYGFGEDTGCARTPKAMVRAWLHSGFHRKNMLGRRFRDLGVGVVKGAPDSQYGCQERGFMTFSVLFSWRKR